MNFNEYAEPVSINLARLQSVCHDNHEAGYLQRLYQLRQRAENAQAKADRTGTGRHSIFGGYLRHDTGRYGPAFYQSKRVHVKGVMEELFWLLSGTTSVKPLQMRGVRIWNEWADANGELGRIYGAQWRDTNTWREDMEGEEDQIFMRGPSIDQIHTLLKTALERPADSGNVVSAWNVGELDQMALRPCHTLWQVCIQDGKLDLMLYQRSADWFLGVPFNAASYTTLQAMLAHMLDLEPGVFHHYFGDTHLYANQLEVADQHLCRLKELTYGANSTGMPLAHARASRPEEFWPRLAFHGLPKVTEALPPSPELLRNLTSDNVMLVSYNPAEAIEAPRAAV